MRGIFPVVMNNVRILYVSGIDPPLREQNTEDKPWLPVPLARHFDIGCVSYKVITFRVCGLPKEFEHTEYFTPLDVVGCHDVAEAAKLDRLEQGRFSHQGIGHPKKNRRSPEAHNANVPGRYIGKRWPLAGIQDCGETYRLTYSRYFLYPDRSKQIAICQARIDKH